MANGNITASVDRDLLGRACKLLMAQAHLTLPHLSDQATDAMVNNLQQLV